jgi:hypothetical protein
MKTKRIPLKVWLLAPLACSLLGLSGCSGQTAVSSPAEVTAFQGNPNAPEAKAAAQRAAADGAQKAAAARAAAQKAPAPRP